MTCINTETKVEIIQKIEHSNIPSSEAQILAEFIEELPVCTIEDTKKSKRGKRPLSDYNRFISICMKSDKRFDICTPKWKILKECIKAGGNFESCKQKQGY